MFCYTTDKKKYVPPKVPYGGGLGVEVYTLRYLYEEHKLLNNFWTASNILKDLCRYLWCKITVFRHVETDFVVSFDTQPPFHINKYTYPATHPHQQLLNKRKKIILSLASKPTGRYYKKFYIKPTKQMISKLLPYSHKHKLISKPSIIKHFFLQTQQLGPTCRNTTICSLHTCSYRPTVCNKNQNWY